MLPCLLDWLYRTTSPFFHHVSLQLLWGILCERVQCLYVSLCASLFSMHTRRHVVKHLEMYCIERWHGACMCVFLTKGVVRQLTRCANDHCAAESPNVLQLHTALYCLCCHSDILFSSIKCWYWLIVLASPGLFFFMFIHTCTRKHAIQIHSLSLLRIHSRTRTLQRFYSLCIFYGQFLLVCPGTNL